MYKPGIVLVGNGGHAIACLDVIERENKYKITGLVAPFQATDIFLSQFPILGSDEDIPELVFSNRFFLICVGQIKSPDLRIKLYEKVVSAGGKLPTIVSPLAYVSSHASIGSGTIIMHGAVVNAGVVIGDNCIVNTGAIIDHEAIVENHSHISTGVILNGGVVVGIGSFIGSGTVIKQGVNVGAKAVIPMSSSIKHDLINDR